MKKISLLIALLVTALSFAQQGINYKAILKDASGNVLANTFMNIQFTIHQTTATGTVVYQEDHNYTTDANGLVILNIGTDASPSISTFATIDWSADLHFLQTTITYSGGTINFDATGFTAVPYAKHADTAENLIGGELDPIFTASEASSITNTDISNWNTDTSTTNETITSMYLSGTNLSITEGGNTTTTNLSNLTPFFQMENVYILNPGASEIKYLVDLSWVQIYTYGNSLIFYQESGYTTFSVNIDGIDNGFVLSGVDFQGFAIPISSGKNITIRGARVGATQTLLFEGLKISSNSLGGILFYRNY